MQAEALYIVDKLCTHTLYLCLIKCYKLNWSITIEYQPETPAISISCTEDEQHRLVFELDGEFEFDNCGYVKDFIDNVLVFKTADSSENLSIIVLDLEKVRFLDSAAMGLILLNNTYCSENGYQLTIRDPSQAAGRLLGLVGANVYFHVEHK
jgi:anti-anti-sigma factor